jgi:hypothetical protein
MILSLNKMDVKEAAEFFYRCKLLLRCSGKCIAACLSRREPGAAPCLVNWRDVADAASGIARAWAAPNDVMRRGDEHHSMTIARHAE